MFGSQCIKDGSSRGVSFHRLAVHNEGPRCPVVPQETTAPSEWAKRTESPLGPVAGHSCHQTSLSIGFASDCHQSSLIVVTPLFDLEKEQTGKHINIISLGPLDVEVLHEGFISPACAAERNEIARFTSCRSVMSVSKSSFKRVAVVMTLVRCERLSASGVWTRPVRRGALKNTLTAPSIPRAPARIFRIAPDAASPLHWECPECLRSSMRWSAEPSSIWHRYRSAAAASASQVAFAVRSFSAATVQSDARKCITASASPCCARNCPSCTPHGRKTLPQMELDR